MTTILKEKTADDQFSTTRCCTCGFPAGKMTNKVTGEVARVWFYRAKHGYVCNLCVESGRAIPVVKMDKKSRKALKRAWEGR